MQLDLVVVNGSVVDGTGAPAFRADVGVRRGRIEIVSRAGGLVAPRVIDAAGLTVAPGFVDIEMGAEDVRLRHAGADPSLSGLEGLTFGEIGRRRGTSAVDAEIEVARRVGMNGASVLIGTASGEGDDDTALRALLAHSRCVVGTSAASSRSGPQNPSVNGAFPRVLGHYVRDLGLVALEEAVRRMTSLPASRVGLPRIGRIAGGCWADLTIFDPLRIRDPPDPERADGAPEGIRTVLVSGVPVVEGGRVVEGVLPGRVLRGNGE